MGAQWPYRATGKEIAMSRTMVLAVDTARHESGRHVSAAVEMVRDLAAKTGDRVVVVHVHEFAVGRFGRLRIDCADGQGERLVSDIVTELRTAGVMADGDIREADYGHVARTILAAAVDHDARMTVLGSSTARDLPSVTFGSVASRLLHLSDRPVLIVPMHLAEVREEAESRPAQLPAEAVG
jgi:nucleotide-binding universal stress UspA family protein